MLLSSSKSLLKLEFKSDHFFHFSTYNFIIIMFLYCLCLYSVQALKHKSYTFTIILKVYQHIL